MKTDFSNGCEISIIIIVIIITCLPELRLFNSVVSHNMQNIKNDFNARYAAHLCMFCATTFFTYNIFIIFRITKNSSLFHIKISIHFSWTITAFLFNVSVIRTPLLGDTSDCLKIPENTSAEIDLKKYIFRLLHLKMG